MAKITILSLGSNLAGPWGSPIATLRAARHWLIAHNIVIVKASAVYRTPPHAGSGLMPWFYNQVLVTETCSGAAELLRLAKRAERAAGRRQKVAWAARPLDIDVLSIGSMQLNWPADTRRQSALVLPHPHLHHRGFVLVPLAEVAADWRHPVLGLTASALLRRQPALQRGICKVGCP